MMTRRDLNELRALSREIQLTEREITRLDRMKNKSRPAALEKCEKLKAAMSERVERLISERARLEEYIDTIPDSITRQAFILRYAYGLPWRDVAARIGNSYTPDAARMMCKNYISKHM